MATLANIKSTVAGCIGTGCGCFTLAAIVVIVFPVVFRSCGDTKKQMPVKQHILTQNEKAEKHKENIARRKEAQQAALKKAKYAKAFSKFEQYVLTLPGVRGTQQFGDSGFRVFIAGDATDYEVRKIGQGLYDRFVVVREPYMNESDAKNCMVFVYDDTGHELGTTSEWDR